MRDKEPVLCDKCGSPAELVIASDGEREAWVCHACKHFISYKPEVWSRCVGYLRPVKQWNKGKCQEFEDRTPYTMPPENKKEGDTDG